eukprot:365720-Chlamydomonas_euryale.AAC.24
MRVHSSSQRWRRRVVPRLRSAGRDNGTPDELEGGVLNEETTAGARRQGRRLLSQHRQVVKTAPRRAAGVRRAPRRAAGARTARGRSSNVDGRATAVGRSAPQRVQRGSSIDRAIERSTDQSTLPSGRVHRRQHGAQRPVTAEPVSAAARGNAAARAAAAAPVVAAALAFPPHPHWLLEWNGMEQIELPTDRAHFPLASDPGACIDHAPWSCNGHMGSHGRGGEGSRGTGGGGSTYSSVQALSRELPALASTDDASR